MQAVEDTTANDGAPQQDNTVEQTAGQSEPNENQEQHGVGSAEAVGSEGHSGEAEVTSAQSADTKQKVQENSYFLVLICVTDSDGFCCCYSNASR